MATNLQIDDKLITKAVKLGGHHTKKAAVTQALIQAYGLLHCVAAKTLRPAKLTSYAI